MDRFLSAVIATWGIYTIAVFVAGFILYAGPSIPPSDTPAWLFEAIRINLWMNFGAFVQVIWVVIYKSVRHKTPSKKENT